MLLFQQRFFWKGHKSQTDTLKDYGVKNEFYRITLLNRPVGIIEFLKGRENKSERSNPIFMLTISLKVKLLTATLFPQYIFKFSPKYSAFNPLRMKDIRSPIIRTQIKEELGILAGTCKFNPEATTLQTNPKVLCTEYAVHIQAMLSVHHSLSVQLKVDDVQDYSYQNYLLYLQQNYS